MKRYLSRFTLPCRCDSADGEWFIGMFPKIGQQNLPLLCTVFWQKCDAPQFTNTLQMVFKNIALVISES